MSSLRCALPYLRHGKGGYLQFLSRSYFRNAFSEDEVEGSIQWPAVNLEEQLDQIAERRGASLSSGFR